jgi:hypothetical protein
MALRQSKNHFIEKAQTCQDLEIDEPGEEKSQEHVIMFFDFNLIVHKEFVLAGQTVNSTCYCHIVRRLCENVERLCPELWRPQDSENDTKCKSEY